MSYDVVGSAAGDARDAILAFKASIIGGALRFRLTPWDFARERYFAVFVNGRFVGVYWAPATGDVEGVAPIEPGNAKATVYVEEVGDAEAFAPDFFPLEKAEAEEEETANRITMVWAPSYKLTAVRGDAQLASIVVASAARGRNVESLPLFPQRGRLHYTITQIGTTNIVRWWAGERLVAEGSRTGNGALTCSEMNASGLSVTCTLAYTGDVVAGAAYLDVCWPKSYQIHYNTNALSYPRTPEATVLDDGSESYIYQTAALASGTWNYNVLQVNDDGTVESAPGAPADSPKTIVSPPAAPAITGVSGSAATLTVTWTVGEAGCTFTVYSSLINTPVNLGAAADPAPVVTALDATSAVIPAVTDYASVDNTSDYTTLASAFDAAVVTVNAAFDAGESGFAAALSAFETALAAAMTTYQAALGKSLAIHLERLAHAVDIVEDSATEAAGLSLTASEWKDRVGKNFAGLLAFAGSLLAGERGRYALSNAALPGGAKPSASVGTGAGADGTSGETAAEIDSSLYDAGQPFVKRSKIRIVVRATKGGAQEKADAEYAVEFDDVGAISSARPNIAELASVSCASSTIVTAAIGVTEDEAAAAAVYVDLYVVPVASAYDWALPSASGTLPAAVAGYHSVSVNFNTSAAGWYKITAKARTSGGARSDDYSEVVRYVGAPDPGAVSSVIARVARGRDAWRTV